MPAAQPLRRNQLVSPLHREVCPTPHPLGVAPGQKAASAPPAAPAVSAPAQVPASAPPAAAAAPAPQAEPSQEVVPGEVKCNFTSTPSGAEITLDGKYVGSTPSAITAQLRSPHRQFLFARICSLDAEPHRVARIRSNRQRDPAKRKEVTMSRDSRSVKHIQFLSSFLGKTTISFAIAVPDQGPSKKSPS